MSRDVGAIAAEMINDLSSQARERNKARGTFYRWKDLVPHAAPYLEAMLALEKVSDHYGSDTGEEVILRALSNLGSYRGPKARLLKKELNDLIKAERRSKR